MSKPQGKFIQLGFPEISDPFLVPQIPLIFKEIQFIGSVIGSRQENLEMLEFVAENNTHSICQEFKFEEFEHALDIVENGKPQFRIVINVNDWTKKNIV